MADWDTLNGDVRPSNDSRKSSLSSGLSNGYKESTGGDSNSSFALRGAEDLSQESQTDNPSHVYENLALDNVSNGHHSPAHTLTHGTAKSKAAKSPYAPSNIDLPEEEISIPNDANLSAFSKEQIATFFRCLKVDDRIISHLYRKSVDGKRFSRMKDSELENVNLKNPVVLFFRDKSSGKNKKKSSGGWIL